MPNYYRVVDSQRPIVQNYFSLLLIRGERVANLVPLLQWIRLTIVEVLFGQELLESFVTTASKSGCPEEPDLDRRYGLPMQLNLHIPSGIFTNLMRGQLVEVMYYKYYLQYLFIQPVVKPNTDESARIIDVSDVRFRFNKDLLYLVIPFRRAYVLLALATTIVADVAVYALTSNITVAAFVAALLEICRRVLKL